MPSCHGCDINPYVWWSCIMSDGLAPQENLRSCCNKNKVTGTYLKEKLLPNTGILFRPYDTEISQQEYNLILKKDNMIGCGIMYCEQKAFHRKKTSNSQNTEKVTARMEEHNTAPRRHIKTTTLHRRP